MRKYEFIKRVDRFCKLLDDENISSFAKHALEEDIEEYLGSVSSGNQDLRNRINNFLHNTFKSIHTSEDMRRTLITQNDDKIRDMLYDLLA